MKRTEKTAAERSSDSKYKGVRKRKWGKWVSEIRLPNSRERIWLGSYDSAEKAARAFDAALFCLRGGNAKFNFPDSPPEIAGGRSLSRAEIQAAAARFANSVPQMNVGSGHDSRAEASGSELQVESPCPSSLSEGTVQLDGSELAWDGPFLDLIAGSNSGLGSGQYVADYGIFPGFDDLNNDFFAPSIVPDYQEENFDNVLPQDSFLWNF